MSSLLDTALAYLVAENSVCFLKDLYLFLGYLAEDTNSETRTRERLSPYEVVGDTELFADSAYLVLEEVSEGLDSAGELDIIGHFYHVVVGLDDSGAAVTCLIASARLDTVGVDSSLCEEAVCSLLSYLIPENVVELSTDYLTLLLGVGNAFESGEELVLAVYADKVHIKKLCERSPQRSRPRPCA